MSASEEQAELIRLNGLKDDDEISKVDRLHRSS